MERKINEEKHFKSTSQKFRKRMEEEQAKKRRTIFLDEELPSTSNKRKKQNTQPRAAISFYR